MNNWNGVDFFIFLIFAVNTILGMARGAMKEIISAMSLSVALIFTIKFTIPLATFFNQSPLITNVVDSTIIQNLMIAIGAGAITADLLQQIFYSISLLICFVGIFSICDGALTITGFVEMYTFPYATLNRKIGGSLGFIRGYVINLIFISIFTLHIYSGNNTSVFSNSFFIGLFQSSAIELDSIISGQQPERYYEILKGSNQYKESDLLKTIQPEQSQQMRQFEQLQQPQQPPVQQPAVQQPPVQVIVVPVQQAPVQQPSGGGMQPPAQQPSIVQPSGVQPPAQQPPTP